MTVKEQIVSMLQAKGYDLLTACELAKDVIKEARESLARGEVYRFSPDNGKHIYEIRLKAND